MIKLCLKILLICAVCCISLFLLESLLTKEVQSRDFYLKKYLDIHDPQTRHDLIIIGASHGVHGINPKELEPLGFDAYNYCYNGANPAFILKWLNKVYLKNKTFPKVVLYDVNWFMFDDQWLARKIEQDSSYLSPQELFSLAADTDTDQSLLIRNRYTVLSKGAVYKYLIFKSDSRVSTVLNDQFYKGYIPQIRVKSSRFSAVQPFSGNNSQQISEFKRIVDLVKSKGATLILVQLPELMTDFNSRNFKNNEIIRSVAKEKQVQFIDYNDGLISAMNYQKELYYDFGHLNQEGSTLFSRKLARDLSGVLAKASVGK